MSAPPAVAFFLNTESGQRFCLYRPPDNERESRGSVLLVPPFAEEMNKSRHMMRLLSQALASHGYASLLIDLHGCGDSEGELKDSSWAIWKKDLAAAYGWLCQRSSLPVSLLGLRLGALLALDFLNDEKPAIKQLLLWQPVLNGQLFLTQFLRLRLAGDMLSGNNDASGGTKAIRMALHAGEVIAIAGYELAPQLALPIDALNAANYAPSACRVDWLELQTGTDPELAPAKKKIAELWKRQASDLQLTSWKGPEFWASQEISACPELIALTVQLLNQTNQANRS
jgi:exosortase A-associated hydrolase 2